MTTNLTGYDAINYAERHGLTLSKYNDPIEGARDGLTPEEAREIAAEDPGLIYVATTGAKTELHRHLRMTAVDELLAGWEEYWDERHDALYAELRDGDAADDTEVSGYVASDGRAAVVIPDEGRAGFAVAIGA